MKREINIEDISCGSDYRAYWICQVCGYEFRAKVADRAKRHTGCPKCGRKKASINRSKKAIGGRLILCVESGKIYSSMKEAAGEIGQKRSTCISNCLHDKQKTAGGFHWKYCDENQGE